MIPSLPGLFVQGYDLKRLKFPPIDFWTKDSTGAETDAREWALVAGAETRSHEPHLTRQIVLDMIALCSVVTVIFIAALANLDARTVATETGARSAPAKPAATDTNYLPPNQGANTKHLDAKTAVLSVDNLPDYRLVSSAKAVQPGGVVPNGWDNVFQKSQPGALDYRMAEAIVVVYGNTDDAIAGVDLIRQAEESQGAKASPALSDSQMTSWVEPLEIRGYEIVRVVFRTDNVVVQIAVLGKDSPALTDDVKALASTQQMRLAGLLQGNA